MLQRLRQTIQKTGSGFRSDSRMISLILSMHCRNVSLRGIAATLNETYGIKVAYKTVYNHLRRYEKMLSDL
ncbi:MAG: hypothetical protein DLM72_04720 [Candidatus Nitrosopolaris wilkensis]|nr:MAG: hypothetical protein DLM72_04720 [Candidatus Nitrosopolaris wilkensis]